MKILAISGSLRADSSNTAILRVMAALAPKTMEVSFYDELGDLPHFSPERDGGNPHPSVKKLREQLQKADGVIICTPEYAFGVPGSLKNALDWSVSSGELNEKPVAAISASPLPSGGDKAHASLLLTLSALGANVAENARLTIPAVRKKINNQGEIIDPEMEPILRSVLNALAVMVQEGALKEKGVS